MLITAQENTHTLLQSLERRQRLAPIALLDPDVKVMRLRSDVLTVGKRITLVCERISTTHQPTQHMSQHTPYLSMQSSCEGTLEGEREKGSNIIRLLSSLCKRTACLGYLPCRLLLSAIFHTTEVQTPLLRLLQMLIPSPSKTAQKGMDRDSQDQEQMEGAKAERGCSVVTFWT